MKVQKAFCGIRNMMLKRRKSDVNGRFGVINRQK